MLSMANCFARRILLDRTKERTSSDHLFVCSATGIGIIILMIVMVLTDVRLIPCYNVKDIFVTFSDDQWLVVEQKTIKLYRHRIDKR